MALGDLRLTPAWAPRKCNKSVPVGCVEPRVLSILPIMTIFGMLKEARHELLDWFSPLHPKRTALALLGFYDERMAASYPVAHEPHRLLPLRFARLRDQLDEAAAFLDGRRLDEKRVQVVQRHLCMCMCVHEHAQPGKVQTRMCGLRPVDLPIRAAIFQIMGTMGVTASVRARARICACVRARVLFVCVLVSE